MRASSSEKYNSDDGDGDDEPSLSLFPPPPRLLRISPCLLPHVREYVESCLFLHFDFQFLGGLAGATILLCLCNVQRGRGL